MIIYAVWAYDGEWVMTVKWRDWGPLSDDQEVRFKKLDEQGFQSHRAFPMVERGIHIRCELPE